MPYADPEKQREADRKRKARARAEKKLRNPRKFARKARYKGTRGRSSFIRNRLRRTGGMCWTGFTFNGRAVRFTIAT